MNREELQKLILGATCPAPLPIDVQGIGPVFVKVMTAFEAERARKRIAAIEKAMEASGEDDYCSSGRLLSSMLCDESGELLFDVADKDAVYRLSNLSSEAQTAIFSAGMRAQGSEAGNA